jgi:uncharacterized protein (UPF0332 family)
MKEATQQLLDKAARAIHAAETLLQAGDVEFATGRAYYAMFYVAEALLNERGLRFRRHGRVHAAFSVQFIKSNVFEAKFHRWLLDAFDQRLQGDYGLETTPTSDDVTRIIEQARAFLQEAQYYLGTQTSRDAQ